MNMTDWMQRLEYEKFRYINQSGKALDNSYNEYRTESGELFYVPKKDRYIFEMVIT
jgi:hypothetical protein